MEGRREPLRPPQDLVPFPRKKMRADNDREACRQPQFEDLLHDGHIGGCPSAWKGRVS